MSGGNPKTIKMSHHRMPVKKHVVLLNNGMCKKNPLCLIPTDNDINLGSFQLRN